MVAATLVLATASGQSTIPNLIGPSELAPPPQAPNANVPATNKSPKSAALINLTPLPITKILSSVTSPIQEPKEAGLRPCGGHLESFVSRQSRLVLRLSLGFRTRPFPKTPVSGSQHRSKAARRHGCTVPTAWRPRAGRPPR